MMLYFCKALNKRWLRKYGHKNYKGYLQNMLKQLPIKIINYSTI